jgi:hypothetical protein
MIARLKGSSSAASVSTLTMLVAMIYDSPQCFNKPYIQLEYAQKLSFFPHSGQPWDSLKA